MTTSRNRIDSFGLKPGRTIAGKYIVEHMLGGGWEGEVYKVIEQKTGIPRAAKLFFPHRNEKDKAVTFHAQKLEKLRHCPVLIQYLHTETIQKNGQPITCLISEYVEGVPLCDFIAKHRGKRLPPFEAMHLLYAIVKGIEPIHRQGEYHGDLHSGNVLVSREGITFRVKVLDFFHHGRTSSAHIKADVVEIVRLLYDATGGQKRYSSQPMEVRAICRGLRHDLINKSFPTARHLREYLETFLWSG